jgi:hypothetical protein
MELKELKGKQVIIITDPKSKTTTLLVDGKIYPDPTGDGSPPWGPHGPGPVIREFNKNIQKALEGLFASANQIKKEAKSVAKAPVVKKAKPVK